MTVLAVFGGSIVVVILMVVSSIFNGYALSVLWGWFMVPTFGLPELSIAPAIGIAIVISYLTHQVNAKKDDGESFGKKMVRGIVLTTLEPSFALLFGYIVHLFM